jgi:hypothetical protein
MSDNYLRPVTCDTCGRTMPRGIADNPETHSCAAFNLDELTGRVAQVEGDLPFVIVGSSMVRLLPDGSARIISSATRIELTAETVGGLRVLLDRAWLRMGATP